MNFLENIKKALFDPRFRQRNQGRGMPLGQTLVNDRDLVELVERFEGLDLDMRAIVLDKREDCDNQKLGNLIRQMWHNNGKNSDEVLFIFSGVIKKLLEEERLKQPKYTHKY